MRCDVRSARAHGQCKKKKEVNSIEMIIGNGDDRELAHAKLAGVWLPTAAHEVKFNGDENTIPILGARLVRCELCLYGETIRNVLIQMSQ